VPYDYGVSHKQGSKLSKTFPDHCLEKKGKKWTCFSLKFQTWGNLLIWKTIGTQGFSKTKVKNGGKQS
jgi:hypothetical protein